VDDPLPVRCLQSLRDLACHLERLAHGQWPPLQALRQRFSGHQLHHEHRRPVQVLDPEQRCDVGMVERGQQPRFAFEPRAALRVARERFR
jgi:hypothetical protein